MKPQGHGYQLFLKKAVSLNHMSMMMAKFDMS